MQTFKSARINFNRRQKDWRANSYATLFLVFQCRNLGMLEDKVLSLVTWHKAKYSDPYSEFVLCIYPSVCTHTAVNTPGAVGSHLCCGTRGAVGGSVPCSRAPRRGIKCGESAVHSLPPPTIPAGPRLELAAFRLWVRLSTIRPRLPSNINYNINQCQVEL